MYSGQYDDLLYYYAYQFELIQRVYRDRVAIASAEILPVDSTEGENASGSKCSVRSSAHAAADAAALAGVPAARLPAALALLKRHRGPDGVGGRASGTLQTMGAILRTTRGTSDPELADEEKSIQAKRTKIE